MAQKYYTTNTLIESVKRREMLPETSATFREEDFLAFANEEMDLGVMPLIMSFHEDYLIQTVDIPIEANVTRYQIPSRAMGNKVREVQFKDDSGYLYEMTRIFIEDLPYFQSTTLSSYAGLVRAFYMESDSIVIIPTGNVTQSGSLRVSYYMRCSEIVSETKAARITAINTTTGEVTLNRWPDNFVGADLFDITSGRSPHNILGIDVVPVALGDIFTPKITFAPTDLPHNLKKNDVVTLAEETIIPQVPVELHSILSQRVAIRCLEALGDTAGVQIAMAKLQEMETKTGTIIDNRAEGSPLKIAPKHTFLRRGRIFRRW